MGSLSQAETEYLKGLFKPSPGYKRVLVHRIRRKKEQMEEELALINEFVQKHGSL